MASTAPVLLALCALVALSAANPMPEPKPFSLGKLANKVKNTVLNYAGDKAQCLQNSGVPTSLITKGVGCGPTALAGPEAWVACAGLASFPEAKKAVKCLTG
ncbi:hypothetical protein FOCC_FOCC011796 [Frankliniella occidentalis]|uniref:Uncharacterized protein LOC113216056 n=1 Tax=Frankliniella occidentalis TaxID=133901 RepID=A0A6J1TL41_FRAOC|nr:uncharacterized protein LOC113216056 [Frankliniella occidentalis]XP_052132108.1 uncharacterized protein LOC127751896 [Frankliniella occidentalis]KAE8737196.1 hypothetical protein FOCC_FOCC017342 [Frankliniella occidentalis]KAE8742667.1 hypothetical protein FOCC_FOCC011796 [Frankliniella occidentalis]